MIAVAEESGRLDHELVRLAGGPKLPSIGISNRRFALAEPLMPHDRGFTSPFSSAWHPDFTIQDT